jgi:hypothetical protein
MPGLKPPRYVLLLPSDTYPGRQRPTTSTKATVVKPAGQRVSVTSREELPTRLMATGGKGRAFG